MGVKLIWDLDNTLVDVVEHEYELAQITLGELGIIDTRDNIIKRNPCLWGDFVRSYGLGEEEFFKVWNALDDRVNGIKNGNIKIYPDTIPVLEKLVCSGYLLGIASNTPKDRAMIEINALGLYKFFNPKAISCYDYKMPCKPEPDLALKALAGLNYDKENDKVLIIGDTRNDIRAGENLKKLGHNAKTIYINRHNLNYEADYVVSSLEEAYLLIQNGL